MAKKKILKQPAILDRIEELREKLSDGGDTTQILEWEKRAKKSLILLSLKGHEGIEMIIEKAKDEIQYRQEIIKTIRPRDFSPEGAIKYAGEQALHFTAIDMWLWFIGLFTESEEDLASIEYEIAADEKEKTAPPEEMKGTEDRVDVGY